MTTIPITQARNLRQRIATLEAANERLVAQAEKSRKSLHWWKRSAEESNRALQDALAEIETLKERLHFLTAD